MSGWPAYPLDRGPTFGEPHSMPIYDYRCAGCGAQFEQLVRRGQEVRCPHCSGADLERLLSLPARPAAGGRQPDYSRLGPPPSGGCCGGGCQSHSH